MVRIAPSACGWTATTGFMGAHCANADDASPNTKSTTRNERGRKVFWSSIFMKTSRHRTLGERNCDSSSVHASGSRRKRHPPNGATAQASFGIDSGKLRQHLGNTVAL